MATKIALITNCDDAVIFWSVGKKVPDCWGFKIEREMELASGQVQRKTLDNRTGFEKDHPKSGDQRPSTEWPFQRFWWADHEVNLGDKVRYRVVPMIRQNGQLHEEIDSRSDWTNWKQLTGRAADSFSSFFNRGLVISQFMSRYLEDLRVKEGLHTRKEALKAFKDSLTDHELPIRKFLSGALRTQLLDLLETARKDKQHVYAALYELEDEELVDALTKFKSRAHVVLSNGSIKAKKGEGSAAARKRDQNKDGRKALKDASVDVEAKNRFISPGALGHNKFLVVADKNGNKVSPKAVWTGSTNWTATALCTQMNNGLAVRHVGIAEVFYEQWKRLRAAGSNFPDSLVEANSKAKKISSGKSRAEIWFTRTGKEEDLAALTDAINGAKDAVLFLMFQPGASGALGDVRKLQKKGSGLYIKGVVSTLPADKAAEGDETEVNVTLHDGETRSNSYNIVQPEGLKAPFASWAANVTRAEFLMMQGGVIGYAIVHSKLIVIDPFTKPVVITGSHNFSGNASTKNDENFVIVRGNRALAEQYAAHILSVYQHYSWLDFVNREHKKGENPKGYLREADTWQDKKLKGYAKKELDFWLTAAD